jgi:hypothetical protein
MSFCQSCTGNQRLVPSNIMEFSSRATRESFIRNRLDLIAVVIRAIEIQKSELAVKELLIYT